MMQQEMNQENKEIKSMAFELYKKHGFKNGNDFVDWLEAEKQVGALSRLKRKKQVQNMLVVIAGILCVIVVILSIMLFGRNSRLDLSKRNLAELKVMMLVLDQQANEDVVAFGDTHFDFNESALTKTAKAILDKEVLVLKENPKMKVRMAGYTSAKGTQESNQTLSEQRANSVRAYMIEKGIAPGRITTIGYGMTKPALYEISPDDINSKEAKANMRVLFEIRVK
ncbi:MAG: hypothetical protein A2297_00095 [Elusimicrobia bacterium RIFOXYB2_FULL_48_7]|nr:MAG: hypothetical protein A2297_00095 [Elusimicrobia bacterium RIFOXYB2_FULL_48_7]